MTTLTICPTKGRPFQFKAMMESYYKTVSGISTGLIAILDPDDPCFYEYMEIMPYQCNFMSVRGNVTQCINAAFNKFPGCDFYHLTNDDVIYKTKNWDLKLKHALCFHTTPNPLGISYGDDLFQGENHPTMPFISGNLARSLGWLQYTKLNRYYGDDIWKYIGQSLSILYYVPDVVIEHMHYYAGKSTQMPDNSMYGQDRITYNEWRIFRSNLDIQKIKRDVGL